MSAKLWMIGIVGLMLLAPLGWAAETGPEGEPELVFDYNGAIDRISNDDIVLDDSWFKLAAQVTFYTKDGRPAYRSSFKVGVRVDFRLDNLGQVDALRLAN